MPNYIRQKVIRLKKAGFSYAVIVDLLDNEDHFDISRRALIKFYTRYRRCGVTFKMRTHYPTKLTRLHLDLIDDVLTSRPDITAKELSDLMSTCRSTGVEISPSTMSKVRRKLGWTKTKTRYCQMIRLSHLQHCPWYFRYDVLILFASKKGEICMG